MGWKKAKKQKKYGKLLKYYLTIELVDCCWFNIENDYSDYSDRTLFFVFKFMSLTSVQNSSLNSEPAVSVPKKPFYLAYGYQSQTKDP